jgi:hypothetical protein
MVSDEFRKIEEQTGNLLILHEELVGEIVHALPAEKAQVERALHLACVTTGVTPVNMAHYINEFLFSLQDAKREKGIHT